jgi:hypothetical protein
MKILVSNSTPFRSVTPTMTQHSSIIMGVMLAIFPNRRTDDVQLRRLEPVRHKKKPGTLANPGLT